MEQCEAKLHAKEDISANHNRAVAYPVSGRVSDRNSDCANISGATGDIIACDGHAS